jgi:phospholipid-translocating ATPase
MWMNTALASQHDVFGLVVYTGIETRANLNSRKIPNKRGQFDIGLNNITKLLFLIMFVGSIALMWT